MLKLPLVSFVVTSFNYENYILKTLESIKSQTYKNFEIIVVDDCSNDSSCALIEQFISDNQDLKITLIKNKENLGQLGSMIEGLKHAQGQFISFIDSDDILMPEYAQSHIRVHLQTSVAFTSCQIIEIGDYDEIHTLKSISSPQLDKENLLQQIHNDMENDPGIDFKILKRKHFGGWYWSPNSSAMFRKASIELIKKYKNTDKWRICPDKYLFNFAHLVGGSAIICKPLIAYRRHKTNAGNCSYVSGNKRMHSDKTTKLNIKNNIQIRPETIKFLWQIRTDMGIRNSIFLIIQALLP